MKKLNDLSESKEVKTLSDCIKSIDINGWCIFIDALSDCEGNEDIKDLCNGYLRTYLEYVNDSLETPLNKEEIEQRLGSVDALDRATFFSDETWLAQLKETIGKVIYGRTETE